MDEQNPDQLLTRKQYQRRVERRNRRVQRRRQNRIRHIRLWRSVRSIRFWSRTLIYGFVVLLIAFWAKFAFVYNIPSYAARGSLADVQYYVTVKSWWFGPPVFNVGSYISADDWHIQVLNNPYSYLLMQLGRYQSVLLSPEFVWVKHPMA